jgi:hypothetical protein
MPADTAGLHWTLISVAPTAGPKRRLCRDKATGRLILHANMSRDVPKRTINWPQPNIHLHQSASTLNRLRRSHGESSSGEDGAIFYYRLYFMSPRDGHIESMIELERANDREAIVEGQRHCGDRAIELWNLGRKVCRWEPEHSRHPAKTA